MNDIQICHQCGKEISEFLPFKCHHCNEYFCIYHFLPENHNCINFKPLPFNQIMSQQPNEEENRITKQQNENPEEPLAFPIETPSNHGIEPKKNAAASKEKRVIRSTIAIIAIISLLSIASIGGYFSQEQTLSSLKIEVSSLDSQLSIKQDQFNKTAVNLAMVKKELQIINNSIDENTTSLQSLQSGDKYHLHDPTYIELTQFIGENIGSTQLDIIKNAKNQGIRCAYVEVRFNGTYSYPLVGFETADKGMSYFEPITKYRVIPIVGKNYADCVEGKPYLSSSDMITQIVTIW